MAAKVRSSFTGLNPSPNSTGTGCSQPARRLRPATTAEAPQGRGHVAASTQSPTHQALDLAATLHPSLQRHRPRAIRLTWHGPESGVSGCPPTPCDCRLTCRRRDLPLWLLPVRGGPGPGSTRTAFPSPGHASARPGGRGRTGRTPDLRRQLGSRVNHFRLGR